MTQAANSRTSRQSKVRRNPDILSCMTEISCSADKFGTRSDCRCQRCFKSSSLILTLLHQTKKFLLCAMQHDADVVGADARDFRHLFIGEVFKEKGDERFFQFVQFEDCRVKICDP